MKTIVVAEIGTAHNGSIDTARALIKAAAASGADAVKFQWVYADEILHPDTGDVELPSGKTRLYDTFKALECPSSFYKECMDAAHQEGVLFACSPFGLRSFDELLALNPDAIKIASPELNHTALLKRCASVYGKVPLLLSSGVSKLADIEAALETIGALDTPDATGGAGSASGTSGAAGVSGEANTGVPNGSVDKEERRSLREGWGMGGGISATEFPANFGLRNTELPPSPTFHAELSAKEAVVFPPLTLLHCVTCYPAPETQSNVACVETLRGVFGVPTGMSDHSLSAVLVPTLAAMKRAAVIEKHFTLSHEGGGLDDLVALEPEQFALMVHVVGQTCALMEAFERDEKPLGVGFKRVSEKRVMQQLEGPFTRQMIREALGDGVKRLAPCERANWGLTNRSLHYIRAMRAGECVKAGDIAALRTEKNLTAGVSPYLEGTIVGSRLTRDVASGDGVLLEDFLQKG